jgi:CRP/FNR family transcriptional activator FtrB
VLAILRPVSTFILAAVVLDAEAALMSARTLGSVRNPDEPRRRDPHGDAPRPAIRDGRLARSWRAAIGGLVRNIKNHQAPQQHRERLANYLLQQRATDNSGDVVSLHHEKRILASLLGMTPENLSRAFAALQKHGVSVQGAVVTLANTAALEQLAKPDPLIDNNAPRSGDIIAEADAEIWLSELSRTKPR